jgi:hypothetical protein
MKTEVCWKCPACARTRDYHATERLVMVICPGCLVEMQLIADVYSQVKEERKNE